ncbi:MAG: tRNA pseudouridine(54/55) synthase Pus10 [Candidatus Aenigmarchaeota archaeon]|nr:tRNA pseudouridine(54/55) synthase Pus10 [Candidatus Aenigmarchaeota archaeon]
MDLLDKALRVLAQPVCNHCMGRQFGQLLSGFGNEERGRMLRLFAAMSIDREKAALGGLDLSNFAGITFHNLVLQPPAEKRCSVCNDFFRTLPLWVGRIAKKASPYEFSTFLVGTKLSFDLITAEEALWERAGIDYCEPLKAEINRELGKQAEARLLAKADLKNPDMAFVVDLNENKVHVQVNPLFIYGRYQKLVRGIPQTKWPSGKYKTSVEQIIAKPFMQATKAKAHKLHGLGREDIDARCLAWRPFVLELIEPKKRAVNLTVLAKRVGRGVKVSQLRSSSIAEVRRIKEARPDKTYRALVRCAQPVTRNDLRKLRALQTAIEQKTPQRVLHRRADRYRKRHVRSIRAKAVGRKTFELIVTAEAGTYIKELISGDNGRTMPNVSNALGTSCVCKELDVVKIHTK